MSACDPSPTLNKYVRDLKETARTATVRAERAELNLAKAEAALRSMDRARTMEKTRADRAEATLRSFGLGKRDVA